jgi:hypothetical protein
LSDSPDETAGPPALPAGRPLPVVRLLLPDGHDRPLVAPPDAPDGPAASSDPADAFDPFPLPPLPLSQHCWQTGLAAEFGRRHRRCLAALLVLDCRRRRWARPLLPAQACGRDGACWTLDPGGDARRPPPGYRVGGSFQACRAGDLFEAAAAVPPLDGLHVVQADTGRGWAAFAFLRAGGQTTVVPHEHATADDWDQALAEAAGWMTFD